MMTRIIPVAIVAVLITTGVALSLSVGAGGGGSQAKGSTTIVDQAVWEGALPAPSRDCSAYEMVPHPANRG